MRYGIPLLKNRVSPRCTIADSVMLVDQTDGAPEKHEVIPLETGTWTDLIHLLVENRVNTLVAGGIDRETQQILTSYELQVIDNVACSSSELLEAIMQGKLRPGFGFTEDTTDQQVLPPPGDRESQETKAAARSWETSDDKLVRFDCLKCTNRVCMRGEGCYPGVSHSLNELDEVYQTMLEVARDVSSEEDRQLCRVAELVYFCLGMKYSRIGLAYCVDLMEPAGILAGLLRRYFNVFPVCCKVGGTRANDPTVGNDDTTVRSSGTCVACNPLGQAEVLNELGTDINIIVGLCMGVDCLFTKASDAPVTTLFVKDKSLVNNPIGAVYSDYYLNEVTRTPAPENV